MRAHVHAHTRLCVPVMPVGEESAAPYGAVKINIKSKNALAAGGPVFLFTLSLSLLLSLSILDPFSSHQMKFRDVKRELGGGEGNEREREGKKRILEEEGE